MNFEGPSDIITAVTSFPRLSAYSVNTSIDRAHLASIDRALQEAGIAIVDLKFSDASSTYLRHLVLGLGKYHSHGYPITHSKTHGAFWDVKPKPESENRARSEGKLTFPWHTDCSFESSPPRFFALHVLHADRFGGGTLSILNASQLIRKLTPSNQESLSRPQFRITVPPEFDKGTSSIIGGLVAWGAQHDHLRIRLRTDIVEPLSEDGKVALDELNQMLARENDGVDGSLRVDFPAQLLPDNTIVLMDNGRWLHSRTEVQDSNRHLRRIRWHRQAFDARRETNGSLEDKQLTSAAG